MNNLNSTRKKSQGNSAISVDDLQNACKAAARIVDLFGDCYLPLFKRLYEELEMAKISLNLKNIALKISQEEF